MPKKNIHDNRLTLLGNLCEFCFITLSSSELVIKDFILFQGPGLILGLSTVIAQIYSGCLTYYFDTQQNTNPKLLTKHQQALFSLVTLLFGIITTASMVAGSVITYVVLAQFLPWAIPLWALLGMGVFASAVYLVQNIARTCLNISLVLPQQQHSAKKLKTWSNTLYTKMGRIGLLLQAMSALVLFAASFQLLGVIIGAFIIAADIYCTQKYFKLIMVRYNEETNFAPENPGFFTLKYGLAATLSVCYNSCIVFSSLWYFSIAITLPLSPLLLASVCTITALSGAIAGSIRYHKIFQGIMQRPQAKPTVEKSAQCTFNTLRTAFTSQKNTREPVKQTREASTSSSFWSHKSNQSITTTSQGSQPHHDLLTNQR